MAQTHDDLIARAEELSRAIRDRIAEQSLLVEELVRGGHDGAADIARRDLGRLVESQRVADDLVHGLRPLRL